MKKTHFKNNTGSGLEFELKITNDLRALAAAESFSHEVLRHNALSTVARHGLQNLVMAAVKDATTHAYPAGESGSILIATLQDDHQLTFTIRDYGLPQDVQKLEVALHQVTPTLRPQVLGLDFVHLADEVHWINYGPDGKALKIIKWLHETPITEHEQRGDLHPFTEAPPLAPEQDYQIRRMLADEAVQVSQLIYKAYGSSYFNRDVYYPERVARLNENGQVISFVAADASGNLVGHYALEKNQTGPVIEGGQAVVDPAHRGRKLLERMKEAAIQTAKQLNLMGMYGDAVTVHTFTQKSNIEHGAKLACANLGISPKSENFHGIEQSVQTQRVTCLLYFLWLQTPIVRTVYAPSRHKEAIARLYENLNCPVTFGESQTPQGHGELRTRLDAAAQTAFLRTEVIGADSIAAIRHAKRELVEKSHAEAVFAELPLIDPGTPAVAAALEKEGFFFCGITPHFSAGGDLLRFVYLSDELASSAIHIQEEIARWLVDYCLADRLRVMAAQE
ncbi:MAG: ATP-binding protein [Chthoniobacterales bacterium]